MGMVNLKINNIPVSVEAGTTILEAARSVAINVPTLCFLKEKNEIGACRMCVVEVKGAKTLVTACVYPVSEGMEVFTNTPRVRNSRKTTLELILSTHEKKCLSCVRSGKCELQTLSNEYGVDETKWEGERPHYEIDYSTDYLVRDNNKCILCRRCVAACKAQAIGVIGPNNRGFDSKIGNAFNATLNTTACVGCGQCIVNCPTGALREKDDTDRVFEAIADPTKIVIVQSAPAIRATLGEEFGLPIGTNVKGKMVAAQRRLGFDKVFDTDFGADMTIMEEATEFVQRVQNGGVLPMITSCSPGWIKYCEHKYPELIPHLSSCKSPQQMTGALLKTWYAQKNNIDPKDIVSVSVMPCTAKKFEVKRDDQSACGLPDVDISITTRELARMIKRDNIDFANLPDEDFDEAMGITTGAAAIFGATGGVMEAALRTAKDVLENCDATDMEYEEVRGTKDIKEAVYKIAGMDIKVAVASGLANAKVILDKIKSGEADYQFIEIMCCPGGCVNGGGQPLQPASVRATVDLKALRANALYEEDKNLPLRKSHKSPIVNACYEEFLGKPGSHKAHEILHTSYVTRDKH